MSLPGLFSSPGVSRVWLLYLQTSLSVLALHTHGMLYYGLSRASFLLPQVASVFIYAVQYIPHSFFFIIIYYFHCKSTSNFYTHFDSLFIHLDSFQYFAILNKYSGTCVILGTCIHSFWRKTSEYNTISWTGGEESRGMYLPLNAPIQWPSTVTTPIYTPTNYIWEA